MGGKMTSKYIKSVLIGISLIALGACNKAGVPAGNAESPAVQTAAPDDPVSSAESAAPAAIAHDASVITVDANGAMTTVRQGNNGWTCMPDNPATPGHDPMCMDGNALKWAQAWMGHKDPPANNVGLMYMLAGGSDASNMDPWGTKPAEGHKWVDTGPHVMVVGADSLNALYPAGPDPDTTKPYVMFGGTPYAHVMMPVK